MKKLLAFVCLAGLILAGCDDQKQETPKENDKKAVEQSGSPVVLIKTSMGDIEVQLDPAKAPKTVKNFLQYVDDKAYDGTIFHRVIPNFMIQGGGFTPDMSQKETRDPIANEADNGLTNDRGTIAMARTMIVDSATNQFFINTKDNVFLNHKSKDQRGYGYCVFGKVISGMDVVDNIEKAETTFKGSYQDVPKDTIKIISITRVKK